MAKTNGKMIANNKKAYHDYFILDTYEAGIALHGTEVKSLRMGKCSIKESFIRVENGEMFIYGMHISPYEKGNIFNKDPLRVRKLLLHKAEINKMLGKTKEKGRHDPRPSLPFWKRRSKSIFSSPRDFRQRTLPAFWLMALTRRTGVFAVSENLGGGTIHLPRAWKR